MLKNIINFFIAVGLLLSQSLGLTISFLQLLQPEPYITNTGFIRSFIGKLNLKGILKTPELRQKVSSAD